MSGNRYQLINQPLTSNANESSQLTTSDIKIRVFFVHSAHLAARVDVAHHRRTACRVCEEQIVRNVVIAEIFHDFRHRFNRFSFETPIVDVDIIAFSGEIGDENIVHQMFPFLLTKKKCGELMERPCWGKGRHHGCVAYAMGVDVEPRFDVQQMQMQMIDGSIPAWTVVADSEIGIVEIAQQIDDTFYGDSRQHLRTILVHSGAYQRMVLGQWAGVDQISDWNANVWMFAFEENFNRIHFVEIECRCIELRGDRCYCLRWATQRSAFGVELENQVIAF